MPSPDEILSAIAPELDEVANNARQIHLELAESQTGKAYRDARNHAVALLAAHTMTLSTREGAAGSVTAVKEGQLSVSFAGSANADELAVTSYGADLLRLRRSYIMTARTVLV